MVERKDDRHVPEPVDDEPDAPASADEIAASQRLRDALEGGRAAKGDMTPELELALTLRAAWEPASLSEDESRAVLDVTPSAAEREQATALREALADGSAPRASDPAEVQLARALRAAFSPSGLDAAEHRRMALAALASMPARKNGEVVLLRRRQTVVRVAFGVLAGGLALAASVVLVITSAPPHMEAPLAKARTTQPLFSEPFKAGETSARIDRIAAARASDFRDNRFTKWGVR